MKTPKLFPEKAKKKFIELEFKSLASKDMFAQELEEETPVTFSKIQITSLDQLTSVNSDLLSLFIDNNKKTTVFPSIQTGKRLFFML